MDDCREESRVSAPRWLQMKCLLGNPLSNGIVPPIRECDSAGQACEQQVRTSSASAPRFDGHLRVRHNPSTVTCQDRISVSALPPGDALPDTSGLPLRSSSAPSLSRCRMKNILIAFAITAAGTLVGCTDQLTDVPAPAPSRATASAAPGGAPGRGSERALRALSRQFPEFSGFFVDESGNVVVLASDLTRGGAAPRAGAGRARAPRQHARRGGAAHRGVHLRPAERVARGRA